MGTSVVVSKKRKADKHPPEEIGYVRKKQKTPEEESCPILRPEVTTSSREVKEKMSTWGG